MCGCCISRISCISLSTGVPISLSISVYEAAVYLSALDDIYRCVEARLPIGVPDPKFVCMRLPTCDYAHMHFD